jgi:recombination protein RecA
MAANDDRQKSLDLALKSIQKNFGEGSIMKLGESSVLDSIDVISTSSLSLDMALGIGGVPRGRVVEIFGPESSGKTTVALHIIAEAQKKGGIAAFIDVEHALDPVYAKALGVDVNELIVSQPDMAEQALEIMEALIRSTAVDVVVLDSVAALVSKAEIEGDMGDAHVAVQARLMSQALRKLVGVVSKTNTTAVFINQLRQKVGVMYGNPEVTSGGVALKYYSSVRIDIRRADPIKDGTDIIGNRTRAKVVKNKGAPPFKTAEFDIMYGTGISKEGDILDMGVKAEVIDKAGSWYAYKGEKIGQGRENAKKYIKDNPAVCAEMENQIREKLTGKHIMDFSGDGAGDTEEE